MPGSVSLVGLRLYGYADQAMRLLLSLMLAVLLVSTGCIEVEIPAGGGPPGDNPTATGNPIVNPPDPAVTDGPDSASLNAVDNGGGSGEDPIDLPESCGSHCDCPQEFDCINARCVRGEQPIHCCAKPECPAATKCWFKDGTPGSCTEQTR